MVRHNPTTELEPLVAQYEHMSSKSRAAEALKTLRRIASLVKPIMRRRSWRVGTLTEFYPSEANLLGLNINRGEKICLRLRYPGDENQFLPFENVVDTMLHELCHNEIGPHNAAFHALWDQLRDEHDTLTRKGYTGEGFLGHGERLGGKRMPMEEARRAARAAAERRRNLTQNSGSRLGGTGIRRGENAREIIAAAAERRNRVQRGCASATVEGDKIAREQQIKQRDVTTTQVEREDESETNTLQAYIELIEEEERAQYGQNYIGVSASNPAGSRGGKLLEQQKAIERDLQRNRTNTTSSIPASTFNGPSKSTPSAVPNTRDRSAPTDSFNPSLPPRPIPPAAVSPPPEPHSQTWTCLVCTLINQSTHLACDACGVERPFAPTPTRSSNTRSTSSQSSSKTATPTHSALAPRRSAYENASRFGAVSASKAASKPMGWTCKCGNWMEAEWWTCSSCGRMKASS